MHLSFFDTVNNDQTAKWLFFSYSAQHYYRDPTETTQPNISPPKAKK